MSTRPDGASLFLSEPQRALLDMVLDRIIPREGELPGAGELGVAGHIDGVVGKSRELRRLFAEGLASIEITGSEMFSSEFAALSGQERVAVLRRVESEHAEFFQALVLHTYAGYYTKSNRHTAAGPGRAASSAPGLRARALRPGPAGKR